MEPWDQALRELRGDYVADSLAKVSDAEGLLDRLAEGPRDRQALYELMRRFHGLAGSGATYGFPQVSAVALDGERECQAFIHRDEPPAHTHVRRWREMVAGLRAQLAEGAGPAAPPKTWQHEAPRPEVLVVDDDESVCQVLSRLLEQEGMWARRARSKAEALAQIGTRLPDALIVDLVLPDGSGYELVAHVRALPSGERPAIVILSLRTGFLDRVEAIHCGADGYFEKPVDWEQLMRRLQHVLDRTRAEPARVLSVEDDPSQAAFIRTVLASAGYEVRICDDPQRFEAELLSFRPDLVLMDIVLPGVSGYDLVRFVRQDERYATLPVVFLTTQGQIEAQIESARAGGDDHLVKPVLPGLLLTTVAARIERGRFLRSLMNRDGLTRLLSHTAFIERARAFVARADRDPQRATSWVMLDLDHFKLVNDRYGHPTGDRVLVALAGLLRRRLRQSDTVGRYGGEEFAILLEDLGEADAVRLVERLLLELRGMRLAAPDGSRFGITFSAGVAQFAPGMSLDAWRQAADTALYAAKEVGRDRVLGASGLAG